MQVVAPVAAAAAVVTMAAALVEEPVMVPTKATVELLSAQASAQALAPTGALPVVRASHQALK